MLSIMRLPLNNFMLNLKHTLMQNFSFQSIKSLQLCGGSCKSFLQNLLFQNSKVVRLCGGICTTFCTTSVQNLVHTLCGSFWEFFAVWFSFAGRQIKKTFAAMQWLTHPCLVQCCSCLLVRAQPVHYVCRVFPCSIRTLCSEVPSLSRPCQTSTLWNDPVF